MFYAVNARAFQRSVAAENGESVNVKVIRQYSRSEFWTVFWSLRSPPRHVYVSLCLRNHIQTYASLCAN